MVQSPVLLTSVLPPTELEPKAAASIDAACSLLNELLPGKVAFPGSLQYEADNKHWAQSSSRPSACTVEPSTPQEVATIFGVIQRTRCPWAVKSGGHSLNPGFSSTNGILIAMSQFKEINYDEASFTVKVGAGNLWDAVFAKLIPLGRTVVGGRVLGVGVAGFVLGGGYAWNTQKYGLGSDNVVAYELVTPTGQILNVTAESHPDLFFGLKGGGNNFGIVTSFILKTHPQELIWGGTISYSGIVPAVQQAFEDFDATNTDPNASLLLIYLSQGDSFTTNVALYYDGPEPPGTFDAFLNTPSIANSTKTRTFVDFLQNFIVPAAIRQASHTVPVIKYTKRITETFANETMKMGAAGFITAPTDFIQFTLEPLHSCVHDHATDSAYPHSAAHPWTAADVAVSYSDPALDNAAHAAIMKAGWAIQQVAIEEGQSSPDAILYQNYADPLTNPKLIFGDNLPKLQRIQAQYDPYDLASLTGGFKFH
ncbi:hypothetical protein M422DRAFT_26409 [Sphaerobolus stellatus SS14]|nr:hypothetical protein M422DRAFT_26409 [Sphaerobolus stellatus SS14]